MFSFVNWIQNNNLPLSKLVMKGERSFTTPEDLYKSITKLETTDNIITQNIKIIHQNIEQLPWIKQISVRKMWPNKLKIHLVEYQPIAYWNNIYLLDNYGKILKSFADQKTLQSMPMLYGPKGSEKHVLMGYLQMSKILKLANYQLKTVSISTHNSWQLTLQNNIKLNLSQKNIIECLQRFINVYPMLLQQSWKDNKRISYIDLRYQSGLAVGWAPAFIDSNKSNQLQN